MMLLYRLWFWRERLYRAIWHEPESPRFRTHVVEEED